MFTKSLSFLHGKEYKARENILAKIPSTFDSQLNLDLSNTPEGRAAFRLIDQGGDVVFNNSWRHSGFQFKTFQNIDIPAALYEYEIELSGIKQRGFVLKE